MALLEKAQHKVVACGCACVSVLCVVLFCVCMSAYVHLGPDEQVLLKRPSGKYVQNGPWSGQLNPFHERIKRKATLLDNMEYAVVEDILTSMQRTVAGPMLLFLGPYDEVKFTNRKVILQKHQFVRVTDKRTGVERVLKGPAAVQPEHTELLGQVEEAIFLNANTAVVTRNKMTAEQSLITECSHGSGVWFPEPLEELVDTRELIHVLPHEAIIVRDAAGIMSVHSGAGSPGNPESCVPMNSGVGGTAFFLPPFNKIVRMSWSTYPNPNEMTAKRRLFGKGMTGYSGEEHAPLGELEDGVLTDFAARRLTRHEVFTYDENKAERRLESIYVDQVSNSPSTAPKRLVTAIDLRTQKSFYTYQVRTVDNVRLLLEGAIFWRIGDVEQMLKMTSDPEGDTWAKCRSVLIGAISSVSLATFMVSFNSIVQSALAASQASSFWTDRGIELRSIELNNYRPTDVKTAETLQSIIRVSVERTNELQKQQSENDVLHEKLMADIRLEVNTTRLLEQQATNTKILAETVGAEVGTKDAEVINSFVEGLNATLDDNQMRLDLFRQHLKLEAAAKDAVSLTGGSADLYISPKDMNLRLQMPAAASMPVEQPARRLARPVPAAAQTAHGLAAAASATATSALHAHPLEL